MICQRCQQKEASVHITQFINGEKQEVHLCEQCAQETNVEMGIPQFPVHNLNNLLGFITKAYGGDKRISNDRCPNCHTPYRKIAETGYVGCSECYESFSRQLEPVLRRIHGTNKHCGKIPQRMGESFLLRREIEELKNNLQQVIKQEEYEEAAKLRDKIKALEEKLGEE